MTQSREETPKGGAFWEWVRGEYTPQQMERISRNPQVYWDYYNQYISPGFPTPEPTEPPLPLGRPQSEKFGLTDSDWKSLTLLGGNSAKVEEYLNRLVTSDYIDQFQARDIWDELDVRSRQGLVEFAYGESDKEKEIRLGQEAWEAAQYRMGTGPRVAPQPTPFTPSYVADLERLRTGIDVPQTERWSDWYQSKYSSIIAQYEAKPIEKRTEETWADYLRGLEPALRRQYSRLSPYERGERPSVFQPRIQTVRR